MLNINEIGSEFWLGDCLQTYPFENNGCYVLSGRTAIDLIVQDILRNHKIDNVYLPAYCCDSMIAPFMNRGIKVDLYDVDIVENKLCYLVDKAHAASIFYVNNYFGYENTLDIKIIELFKKRGSIILYDKTHSLLMSNDSIETLADYSFASIRKWMGVLSGAIVCKKNGRFNFELAEYPYLKIKKEAMEEKFRFLSGDVTVCKKGFMDKFSTFAHHLKNDYMSYKMDELSLGIWMSTDKVSIRNLRRRNAKILHDGISLPFLGEFTPRSCPIFVPVLFENRELRDLARTALIAKQIYCPVHWPKNVLITEEMKVNRLFDSELSLICDQRYSVRHMQYIVDVVNKIF